ncbi:hypothetical protein [Alkalibacillus haloalkaliphilus]|uniref:hypothetical protein n=1 Tax=Alkalibacillus haloalkaliphilus TaxID=94136 RepID=UPI002935D9EC|nr:hypothetical protein [Alkalibacillus haloalkaliphilus]MDV2583496.1 hypothetical protein [Alkalibacillus haloalkaliphilus]
MDSDTSEQKEFREKLIEVIQLGGDLELEKEDFDEAVSEAASLDLQGEERDWFVRSYLIYITAGKDIENKEQVYEHSQLRMLYEQTWKDLAFERYGVELDEERLREIIEMSLNPLKEENLSSERDEELEIPFYLADALGYTIDEFFYIFDRSIYERWALGEKLYPLLEEEYELKDHQEISEKYKMEVIDEIVKNNLELTGEFIEEG